MPTNGQPEAEKSYHGDWLKRSRINYFSCFMELWVGFNAWFKHSLVENQDRACINKIKLAAPQIRDLYDQFDALIKESHKDAIIFRGNLEALYYTLNAAQLKYSFQLKKKLENPEYKKISFNSALIDHSKRIYEVAYEDLFHSFLPTGIMEARKERERLEENPELENEWITLDLVRLKNDPELIFSGLIEIIYQVRCKLFHGSLNPDNSTHYEVVKYSYEILQQMAKGIKAIDTLKEDKV